MARKTTRSTFKPQPGEIYDLFAPGGPRKLEKGGILLQPEHEYWIGASSSPDLIVVSRVTDEWVYFYRGDFRKERREMRPIADDLIRHGTQTWVDSYGKHFEKSGIAERLAFVAALRGLLEGKASPLKCDYRSLQRVRSVVRQRPGFKAGEGDDLWHRAEQYGGVGSFEKDAPDYIETGKRDLFYSIHGTRGEADKLAKDPAFEIVSAEEVENDGS